MNTMRMGSVPLLKQNKARDYVILLEDLEFAMAYEQLSEITKLHNNGLDLDQIANLVKRNRFEVLLALIHQAKTDKVDLRPLNYKKTTKNRLIKS